jgi:hypothetical protein
LRLHKPIAGFLKETANSGEKIFRQSLSRKLPGTHTSTLEREASDARDRKVRRGLARHQAQTAGEELFSSGLPMAAHSNTPGLALSILPREA